MPAQSYSRSMIRFASLLLTILVASAIAHAQTIEVAITVTGPWDYLRDPDDPNRVVIVAPQADYHLDPVINSASQSPSLPQGRYTLAIANQSPGCRVTSPAAGQAPLVFRLPQAPTADKIRGVIKTAGARYAISLPKPCYYSKAAKDATSFSIISTAVLTTAAAQKGGKAYTTLMVLHYFVTTIAGATLTGTPDKGNISPVPLQFDQDNQIGIKIDTDHVVGHNTKCDSTSADSFVREVGLFTAQTFHVWFPEYDMTSGVQFGNEARHYLPGCQDPVMIAAAVRSDMPAAAEVRGEISNVERYFANPSPENKQSARQTLDEIQTTIEKFQSNKFRKELATEATLDRTNQELNAAKAQLDGKKPNAKVFDGRHLSSASAFIALLTAGSGDCHGAQTSVDGVL